MTRLCASCCFAFDKQWFYLFPDPEHQMFWFSPIIGFALLPTGQFCPQSIYQSYLQTIKFRMQLKQFCLICCRNHKLQSHYISDHLWPWNHTLNDQLIMTLASWRLIHCDQLIVPSLFWAARLRDCFMIDMTWKRDQSTGVHFTSTSTRCECCYVLNLISFGKFLWILVS